MRSAFPNQPEDAVELENISTGGGENQMGEPNPQAAESEAAREGRLQRAIATSEVTRTVLLVLHEYDMDGGEGALQEAELKATLRSWSTAFKVRIILFAYVAPRSQFRRLLLQSPAAVRGAAAARFAAIAQAMKQRIESFVIASSHRKVSVDVHIDAESTTFHIAVEGMLTQHQPHFTLISEQTDQHSLRRYVAATSREALVHRCAQHNASVIVCRHSPPNTPSLAAPDRPRTFLCCINADAMFGHLPTPVTTAAALTKIGDTLIVYASYSSPDVAAAAYSTDSDWFEKVRNSMTVTKETVDRVVERVRRYYPGLTVRSTISELPLLEGVQKAVEESQPHGIVVGAGAQHQYLGRKVSEALWGSRYDQVARAFPNLTVVVASSLHH